MLITDSHEAPEAEDGVVHLARAFSDHDPFDRTDFLSIRPIYGGAFHLIASDAVVGFTFCHLKTSLIGRGVMPQICGRSRAFCRAKPVARILQSFAPHPH